MSSSAKTFRIAILISGRGSNMVALIDAAQSVSFMPLDVQRLDCDFLAFSGHKLFGPTGIGVLYGRESLLAELPPFQGGGDMILSVSFEGTTYNTLPYKFEAGTPNIAGAIGLGAAVDYLQGLGMENVAAWEAQLLAYGTDKLTQIEGFRMIGTAARKAGVMSFVLGDIHANDVGTLVDLHGVAIRTGHHCAMPVAQFFGLPATARASLGVYNTFEEIDILAEALEKTRAMFG